MRAEVDNVKQRFSRWLAHTQWLFSGWCSRQDFRKMPLACLNRLLLTLALIMTVLAPVYLWYDASVVTSLGRVPTPEIPLSQPVESEATSPVEPTWIDEEFAESPNSLSTAPHKVDERLSWIDEEFAAANDTDSITASTPEQQANDETDPETVPIAPQATASSRYAQIAARRNYFRMNGSQDAASSPQLAYAAEGSALAQRYSVLGILSGESPRAIIREIGTNNSLILSSGQSLGEYVVRQILTDRIILELGGQRVELRM